MKSDDLTPRWPTRIPRRDVIKLVRWYELNALAKFLNGDGAQPRREEERLRSLARQIVEACRDRQPMAPIPMAVAERFNRLAEHVQFTFSIAPARGRYDDLIATGRGEPRRFVLSPNTGTRLAVSGRGVRAQLVKLLVDYFGHASPERLKVCPHCERWFVDQTRNNARARCSLGCTWRWWSRDRRQRAGHSRPRRRGYRRGRGARSRR